MKLLKFQNSPHFKFLDSLINQIYDAWGVVILLKGIGKIQLLYQMEMAIKEEKMACLNKMTTDLDHLFNFSSGL